MEINEISSNRYQSIFKQYDHIYNSVQFNILNEYKCEKIIYLLFIDNNTNLGLIAGITDGILTSPLSAPFGGFSTNSSSIKFEKINEAIQLLDNYSKFNQINSIKFILPPYFYNEDLLSKTYYSLTLNGYTTTKDINYHFNTSNFTDYEEGKIDRSSLKNIRKAISIGLTFEQVFSDEEKSIAYGIIAENRNSKGRPIHLNFDQLTEVGKIIDIDFFLVHYQDHPIASAIVFHLTPKIVQVVYWGDISEYSIYRPMNFIAFKTFEFYHKQGLKIIDLATASLNGTPNIGLCNFKENIGCSAGIKYTMQKTII